MDITRRLFAKAVGALTATFPQPQRPDQVYDPSATGVAPGSHSGILRARKVIIIGSGGELLVYSPTAAFGNLVASIIAGSSVISDQYGNKILPGITDYSPNSSAVQLFGSQILFYTFSSGSWVSDSVIQAGAGVSDWAATVTGSALELGSTAVPWKAIQNIAGQTLLVPSGTPSAATSSLLEVQGEESIVLPTTGTALTFQVTGDADPRWQSDGNGKMTWGTGAAAGDTDLFRGGTGILKTDNEMQSGTLFTAVPATNATAFRSLVSGDADNRWQSSAAGTMSWGTGAAAVDTDLFRNAPARLTINDTGFVNNYTVAGWQPADFTKLTSTATSFVVASKNWQIPANDANIPGAIYELQVAGLGKTGTTANGISFGALASGGPSFTIPGTFATTATAISWEMAIRVKLITTGATGTADVTLTGGIGPLTGPGLFATSTTTGVAFNTGNAFGVVLETAWAAISGTPTMTSEDSIFGRLA